MKLFGALGVGSCTGMLWSSMKLCGSHGVGSCAGMLWSSVKHF